jgi:hypothetical protein
LNTSLKAVAVFIVLAGSAWAEGPQVLPDDALLGEVIIATENGEEERLLKLMREVQARGLLMFPKLQACTFRYPDTEFFRNEIFRGTVRWGFGTDLSELAMSQGFCGCIYDLGSLDAFTQERVGKAAQDATTRDFSVFRKYRRGDWSEVNERYQAFQSERCGR